MPFDEVNQSNGDPIEGKGKEIIPERGMPFEEVTEDSVEEDALGPPRDVSPEELAVMFDEVSAESLKVLESEWLDIDSGMGAAEPIMSEGDFISQDLQHVELETHSPEAHSLADISTLTIIDSPEADKLPDLDDLTGGAVLKQKPEGQDSIMALWARIEKAKREIHTKVPSLSLSRELLEKLEEISSGILAGGGSLTDAERTISAVEIRIALVDQVKHETKSAVVFLAYELLWAVGWVILIIGFIGQSLSGNLLLAQSAAWGSLGGIAFALYALWKHVYRDLDFSKRYAYWYFANPVVGAVLGIFVFLLINLTLQSLFSGSADQEISSPFVIYLLAFVVGSQQNIFWNLIRRVVKDVS